MKEKDLYTLTRATECETCKGPLTIEYRPGPRARGAVEFWVCPHPICGASNLADVMGEIIDIWPGYREFPRYRVRDRIRGYLVESGKAVRLRDISFGGFASESADRVAVGHVQIVRFTTADDQSTDLEARALHGWASTSDDGKPCYVTGFIFVTTAATALAAIERLIDIVMAADSSPSP